MPILKTIKIGHHEFLYNKDINYFPYFTFTIRQRIRKKLACNVAVTGEARIGKSYTAADILRGVDNRFDIDCIVFRYSEFMKAVLTKGMGVPIEFDEPSYALSKRDWYKEMNKALVQTIESFGYKVHPLFIPIINKSLLDKTVRSYLIQYQIVVLGRGLGRVYRMYPSQTQEKVYPYYFCTIKYGLYDNNLCSIDSCLGCQRLDPKNPEKRCMIFRAQYERKKALTQDERYEQAIEQAERRDSQNLTIEEIEAKAMTHFDEFFDKDNVKIDIEKMNLILWRKFRIKIGHNKKYELAKAIKYDHPELFKEAEIDITTEVPKP